MTAACTLRIIDRKQLRSKILYSSTHISRLERAGRFPQRVRLGANRVGWIEAEIDAWIAQKALQRADATPLREAPTGMDRNGVTVPNAAHAHLVRFT